MSPSIKSFKVEFWSSTEYAGFLEGLIGVLQERGVGAEQRYRVSEKSYRRARCWWQRIIIRIEQYVSYPLQLLGTLVFGKRPDVMVVCTNTFYAPFLATFFHDRVIFLVYDLFPEALIRAGKLKNDSLLGKILHWVTQSTFERASAVVFLGEQIRKYAQSHYQISIPCGIVPVGSNPNDFKEYFQTTEVVPQIMYCGNLGHMHEVATLTNAWDRIDESNELEGLKSLLWRIHATGPKIQQLESAGRRLAKLDVIVGKGLSRGDWIRAMSTAHLGLVTMIPGAEKVLMPSKTYSAMAAGQAILAIAPEESDLVDLVKEFDCGWWSEPGDVDGFIANLKEIVEHPDELERRRRNAWEACRKHFSQEVLAEKWIALFEEIMGANGEATAGDKG